MKIHFATLQDLDLLIKLRLDYLSLDNTICEKDKIIIEIQAGKYFKKHLISGDFIGVIATINGIPASCAFLLIQERPANLSFITGITGTVINVLTYPKYRKLGLATIVMKTLIEEAKKINISSLDLLATEEGVPLYEKLGFQMPPYSAMRLKI